MLACLSPNGMNRYDGASAPDRLLIATSSGVTTLVRESSGAWRKAGTSRSPACTRDGLDDSLPGFYRHSRRCTHGDAACSSAKTARAGKSAIPASPSRMFIPSRRSPKAVAASQLYAGTQPAALFKKDRDLGQSWRVLPALRCAPGTEYWTFPEPPHIAHTKMMAFDPRTPAGGIYAAIEQGALLKTEWMAASPGANSPIIQSLTTAPIATSTRCCWCRVAARHCVHYDRRRPLSEQRWRRPLGAADRRGVPPGLSRPLMLSPDEKISGLMSGAKFHPGFWMGTPVADTTILRSRDHGRSWDTGPMGFAVAPRANIEALTMACWPGGYELFVGDTEGTVHMSEDGGDSWTRIADEVGCVTKGSHAALLRGEIGPHAAAAH